MANIGSRSFGFTVIEIAVVLTISVLLLTTASMSLASAEKKNRDNERSNDIAMMAQCLENKYLATQEFFGTIADMEKCPKATDFMTPPRVSAPAVVLATNATATTTGVRPVPTKDSYVFQPLTSTGVLCVAPSTVPCAKYNLFYLTESDQVVQKVSSSR